VCEALICGFVDEEIRSRSPGFLAKYVTPRSRMVIFIVGVSST